jgi:hypothetical protein
VIDPAWYAIPLAGVALAVYLRTMCRTIYVGDSGELAAAVHVMGIPHPPGYPLYVLLGKLFSALVPVGSPALRLNLFSAACTSVSVAFVYLAILALGFAWHVSAAVSLTWAMTASLWSQSGIARVYALGAVVSAMATYFAVRWYVDPTHTRWLVAAALVVGLGLANHPVVAGHAPAILALVLFREPWVLGDPWLWALGLLCLVPPMLLYFLWIPLRARTHPAVNWGNIKDWNGLRNFLGRKEYWRHRYVRSAGDAVEVIRFYVHRIGVEYGFLATTAIVIGLVIQADRSRPLLAMVIVLFLLTMASMIAHARREDIFHWTRYMITAWIALVIPLAFGWNWILSGLPAAVQPFLAFAPAVFLFLAQFRGQDLSRHRYADEYSRRILMSLPENATLIAQDDNVVFPMMYLRHAEHVRPDVTLLEQGVHQLQQFRFNPRKDVVYCTHWQAAFNQPATPRGAGLRLVNEGLIYRVVSTDMNHRPLDLWPQHMLPDMEDERIPRNYLTRCLLGHVYFMRGEWELPRDAVCAAAWYARAARMAWDNAVMHYNLGLVYERHGWRLLAEDAFAAAGRIDRSYRREDPPSPKPPPAPPLIMPSLERQVQ